MGSDPHNPGARGVVVALVSDGVSQLSEHERCTLLGFARELAGLRGEDLAGFHARGNAYPGHVYFVPHSTLTADEAGALGIAGPQDLFGGVVPHAFVATKAISHPLVDPSAPAPAGWSPRFGGEVADCVLRGYTVFGVADARAAGRQLLARGPVRLKPVRASGSRGQAVVHDDTELLHALQGMDGEEIATHGLVLEEDLQELRTLSIGQVHAAGMTASYFGRQRATRNNRGLVVYGGSELTMVRGGYDALLALQPEPEVVHALRQARRYDAAVRTCYPGFYASRCNYDVILGRDATGAMQAAVLEQSWRAGGGTGPELAGLQRLQAEPRRHVVRAASVEAFGPSPEPPPGATVYYRGTDPHVGPMTKYTIVDPA